MGRTASISVDIHPRGCSGPANVRGLNKVAHWARINYHGGYDTPGNGLQQYALTWSYGNSVGRNHRSSSSIATRGTAHLGRALLAAAAGCGRKRVLSVLEELLQPTPVTAAPDTRAKDAAASIVTCTINCIPCDAQTGFPKNVSTQLQRSLATCVAQYADTALSTVTATALHTCMHVCVTEHLTNALVKVVAKRIAKVTTKRSSMYTLTSPRNGFRLAITMSWLRVAEQSNGKFFTTSLTVAYDMCLELCASTSFSADVLTFARTQLTRASQTTLRKAAPKWVASYIPYRMTVAMQRETRVPAEAALGSAAPSTPDAAICSLELMYTKQGAAEPAAKPADTAEHIPVPVALDRYDFAL